MLLFRCLDDDGPLAQWLPASLATLCCATPGVYPAPGRNDHDLQLLPATSTDIMSAPPSSTIYMPVLSPPTPAPSPRLSAFSLSSIIDRISESDPAHVSRREFAGLSPPVRLQYLAALLSDCTPSELLFISTTISPLLKRDFLRDLPPEISLHILSYLDDPQALARASRVSKSWNWLLNDQWLWRRMCYIHGYALEQDGHVEAHRGRRVSARHSGIEGCDIHGTDGGLNVSGERRCSADTAMSGNPCPKLVACHGAGPAYTPPATVGPYTSCTHLWVRSDAVRGNQR